MLELGQNLRIIPKETAMDKFWASGFSENTMPEEYVYKFTRHPGFSYTHLTATLHKAIRWREKQVILTGIMDEVFPPDKAFQKPMTFSVKAGTAYIGFELADSLNIKEGDTIDIFDKKLTVEQCLSATGSSDDIRIYTNLVDAQAILKLPGRINEIKALECMCFIQTDPDPLKAAQIELEKLMPEGKVLLLKGIADIRFKQRTAIGKHMDFIMLCILIGCGIWIAVLTLFNTRQRKAEIGIMRAIGYDSLRISMLFLSKALLFGIIGAVLGFLLGTELALEFGPKIFTVTARAIKPDYSLLRTALIWAPLLAAVAGFIPVMMAVAADPAQMLREE
jgi:putative ABC transport system permease protein